MAELNIEVRHVELPGGPKRLPVAFAADGGVEICVALLDGRLIAVHKRPYRACSKYAHTPDARPITECACVGGIMSQLHLALTAVQEAWSILDR